MEHFPDGVRVRLRSRLLSTYLRADTDREGISLSPYRGSLNTAWTVRRVVRGGVTYVVFHGDAYRRFIGFCPEATGQFIIQRACDAPEDDDDFLWVAISPRDGGAANVLLRHATHDAYLVSGIPDGDESWSKQWLIEVIPHDTSALRSLTLPASDADTSARVPAFEFFPDRAHVRLRSRTSGRYMFAAENGVGVRISPHRATLNSVWAVHQVQRHGTIRILLHSAAYGRYLAYSDDRSRSPTEFVQNHYYHDDLQDEISWQVFRARSETLGSTKMLDNDSHKPRSEQWEIELVPPRARPPLLPVVPEPSHAVHQNLIWRNILYVVGDDFGSYDQRGWRRIRFQGSSVSLLRNRLAEELEEEDPVRLTLCVWSGYLGRLSPLVIDLPSNDYTIKIIVYVSWSAAALGLRHPNVDAPEPATGRNDDSNFVIDLSDTAT